MIRQEIRRLAGSRYENGAQMYPGQYLFTWVRAGAVWCLVALEEVT